VATPRWGRGKLRAGALAVRQVPERFVPRDALASPEQVVGRRVAGALAAGGYVTAGALAISGLAGALLLSGRARDESI